MPGPIDLVRRRNAQKQFNRLSQSQRNEIQQRNLREQLEYEREQRVEHEIAEREQKKELDEQREKITKLVLREAGFFKEHKYTVEEMEKVIDKVIESKRAGITPELLRRMTTNIIYMLEEIGQKRKLTTQQKVALAKRAAIEIGISLAENPNSKQQIRRDPGQLNVLVRETFDEILRSQN